jgi:hypothetical protein
MISLPSTATIAMSSQVDASLHSHEVADMVTFFDKVHKAEEEQ